MKRYICLYAGAIRNEKEIFVCNLVYVRNEKEIFGCILVSIRNERDMCLYISVHKK